MDVGHFKTRWLWISVIISGVLAGDWLVDVSENLVLADRGSSLTVSCHYDFPEDPVEGKPRKVISEMWCRNQSFCITPTYVYHSDGIFPDLAFQGRVRYLGSTGSKDCSFRIDDLRPSDSGVYMFRFITDHTVKKLPGQKGFILHVKDGSSATEVSDFSITGIVVGVVLSLTAIVFIAVCIRRHRRSRSLQTESSGDGVL